MKIEELSDIKYRVTAPFRRFKVTKIDKFRGKVQRFRRGYAWEDVWNLDVWFIETVKPMLQHLLKYHCGTPVSLTPKKWEGILERMIELLDYMDEDGAIGHLGITQGKYSKEDFEKLGRLRDVSKDEFFKLFSEWFYDLWD